jgi:plastocyanin
MIPVRLATIAFLAGLTAAQGGTLTGTVRGQGATVPAEGNAGSYQSRRFRFAEKVDYDRLTDFVIYVDEPKLASPTPATGAITTQKNALFDPHVLPVEVGTIVSWPNQDDIYHNVFSMSEPKPFDLGLYHRERVPELKFVNTGRVDVFCSIHSQMHCIILVLPNRFFAKADANQRFTIRDIPAGTYKVRAWHERLPAAVKEIVVPETGEVQVDFVLGLGELPKY